MKSYLLDMTPEEEQLLITLSQHVPGNSKRHTLTAGLLLLAEKRATEIGKEKGRKEGKDIRKTLLDLVSKATASRGWHNSRPRYWRPSFRM